MRTYAGRVDDTAVRARGPGVGLGLALLSLAALASLAACAQPSGLQPGDVSAVFTDEGVRIVNEGPRPAYYIVVNPRSLALWAICEEGPDRCPSVPPGGSVVVPVSEILGWAGDADADAAEVRYYALVPDGRGGWKAGPVHLLKVPR